MVKYNTDLNFPIKLSQTTAPKIDAIKAKAYMLWNMIVVVLSSNFKYSVRYIGETAETDG